MTALINKAVFLDAGSMGEDLDLSALQALLPQMSVHQQTTNEQIASRIAECELIIVNKVRLGADHFAANPKLKLICLTATGSDNIDIEAAEQAGITVCNISGYSIDCVPQHALTLMLLLASNAVKYINATQTGQWSNAAHFSLLNHPIIELKNKVLGIIGYGNLGQRLHQLVEPFGMSVLLCNLPGREPQAGRYSLNEMLPQVDFLSLHCPLTAATKNLLGEREFAAMKASAFVINTARGQLIDDQALVSALKQGQIAGAALDVLNQEPPPIDHPLMDTSIPNLIITPHNAWGSLESRTRLLNILIDNIKSFYAKQPQNVVRPK